MNETAQQGDRPYMVDEFGEVVYLRPSGCPECEEPLVTVHALSCWRCHAQFDPTEPIRD